MPCSDEMNEQTRTTYGTADRERIGSKAGKKDTGAKKLCHWSHKHQVVVGHPCPSMQHPCLMCQHSILHPNLTGILFFSLSFFFHWLKLRDDVWLTALAHSSCMTNGPLIAHARYYRRDRSQGRRGRRLPPLECGLVEPDWWAMTHGCAPASLPMNPPLASGSGLSWPAGWPWSARCDRGCGYRPLSALPCAPGCPYPDNPSIHWAWVGHQDNE
ncbi:hypothetical protein B0I35DRAFT_24975 [Stachybotrys elegans]|uniref:Uncharacterized protein n=1 Tax=Stachybotrys elegans TaxID=80388 RepID=A0A8K0SYZ7_9HYPO|nr:hypothetical protein B0I35DRAFT_24975 [Stachybotrys elegans]